MMCRIKLICIETAETLCTRVIVNQEPRHLIFTLFLPLYLSLPLYISPYLSLCFILEALSVKLLCTLAHKRVWEERDREGAENEREGARKTERERERVSKRDSESEREREREREAERGRERVGASEPLGSTSHTIADYKLTNKRQCTWKRTSILFVYQPDKRKTLEL